VLGQPPYVAPRYQTKIWGRVIFAALILVLIAVGGVGGGIYWSLHRAQGGSSLPISVSVRQGETVSSLADSLQRQGIINSALLFRLDARFQNLGGKLKAGDYRIRRDMSIDDMVNAFTILHDRKIKILIPEGLRAEQIATVLQAHGINGQQFIQQVLHPALNLAILSDKPAGRSLEGYLFPNTYDVPPRYSARDFAQLMVLTLGKNFTPAMRQEAARQHRSTYDVLTLASIVEREAKVDSDRPKIASVFLNRLRQGIPLYSDPTVQYAAGTPSKWWPVLRDSPSNVHPHSPYNTYTHGGLPPGPISNPGLRSIEAALNPAKTDYLYFVAMNDCKHHVFARTLEEQQINQQKYHCQV
jgi:UPF0755 protein